GRCWRYGNSVLRHQIAEQRCGGCVTPTTPATPTSGGSSSSPAPPTTRPLRDIAPCAAPFVFFVELCALVGCVLGDRCRGTSGGTVQKRLAVAVEGIHVNAAFDEKLDGIKRSGNHRGGRPVLQSNCRIGTTIEQQLDNRKIVGFGRTHQGRRSLA